MKNILLILYGLVLLLFMVFSYAFIDPNLFYLKSLYIGFAFHDRLITTVIYSIFLVLFFGFYSIFLFSWKEFSVAVSAKVLLLSTVVIGFLSYPAILSYDIFNYIATAKVLFHYHENPYIIMPIEFTKEPMLAFMHAANKTALYGVTWIGLTGIPFFLGLGNFLLTLFSFKLLIVGFYLLSLFLIRKISKSTFTVFLFALNPLVVTESLVSGHNDIVMMAMALGAFYLLSKKKMLLAVLLLVLSFFIKYATIFLVPVFLYVVVLQIRKKTVDWEKVYLWATMLMFGIFLLSAFREEIYPWYAQWFLVFAVLLKNKWVKILALSFSFSLLLRDIPFMLLGTYFGPTPFIKTFVTFAIPLAVSIVFLGKLLLRKISSKGVRIAHV